MGHLKLCAAIGAWIGPGQLVDALILAGLSGGVFALGWALSGNFVGEIVRNSCSLLGHFFRRGIARQSGQKTLLIDMDLPLGDVALNLGVSSRYSTIDALQNYSRVDSTFLSRLLVHHSSGLAVLPAPGRFPAYQAPADAIDRLLCVARQDFDNVVVDAGSKFDLANGCTQYRETSVLYLVTQSGIPELRNATQLIAQCQSLGGPKLEIVLNRYEP